MFTRSTKNIGGIFLCAFAVCVTGIAFAVTFSDIGTSKSKKAIQYLSDTGIISGYPDGTFRPSSTINRAEFLKVLTKMTGADPSGTTYGHCFPDVQKEWFAPFVCYAKNKTWIGGYKDGTFRPGNTVTRVEAIKMIVTAGHCTQIQSAVTSRFTDVLPGTWYTSYVQAAENAGLLQWVEGRTVGLTQGLTRGEMSELLYRCLTNRSSTSSIGFRGSSSSVSSGLWIKLVTAMHRSGGGGRTYEQTAAATSSAVSSSSSSAGLITPTISLSDIGKNYGDAGFTLSPTSDSAGTFSFVSSNTAVATISGNSVTIVAAGSTTITVNQAANGAYGTGSTTATLTISAIAPTIGTFTNVTKQIGDIPFALTAPTSNSAGAFTYVSGNASIATISGNTVTLVGPGTTTITATQAANGNYTSGVKVMATFRVVAGQCQLEEPCLNGGSCTNGPGGTYVCSCAAGFSGTICEMDDSNCNVDSVAPCLNGGTCVPTSAHGECSCATCFGGPQCELYQCL